MYDSPPTRAPHTTAGPGTEGRADEPPQCTLGGLAVYAAVAALTPVVLAAVAYPAVTAAAVAGLVAGTVGTRLVQRAFRTRARSAPPVDAPSATEAT